MKYIMKISQGRLQSMKEIYEKPEMIIIRFEEEDIITTSGIGNSTGYMGERGEVRLPFETK